MITTRKPLSAMTARELMSHEVIVVPQHMSLQAAARLLAESQISGAPVVDGEGRCVGVLSGSDFVHWARGDRHAEKISCAPVCVCSDWQMVEVESLPEDEVRFHMTADPVTARPETSVLDLARMMLDAHIHRVIVVDTQSRPIGIVASTDFVAAVAYAK